MHPPRLGNGKTRNIGLFLPSSGLFLGPPLTARDGGGGGGGGGGLLSAKRVELGLRTRQLRQQLHRGEKHEEKGGVRPCFRFYNMLHVSRTTNGENTYHFLAPT
jgi:hypothetical protein